MTKTLSPEAYEQLIEHSVDILTVLDESGDIKYESPSIRDVLGYEPADLEGRCVFDYIHPDDRPTASGVFSELVESDGDYTTAAAELRFRHEDGSWVWIEARGSNQMATALEGYLVSSRDISDRKEFEQQLQRERDRLDRFVGVISHDLRNPLNVIEGQLELARYDCDSEHLDRMTSSVDRINELIEDLIALAREGKTDPSAEAVDLRNIAQTCWKNVDTKGATISIQTDRTIVSDSRQLKQLLENLFRNAIEHGGEGVTITVGALEDGFYVADDGRGIPEDVRESVLDDGFSTKSEGTGLGLSIVKEVVENHDWNLAIEEGTGSGARFEITGVDVD